MDLGNMRLINVKAFMERERLMNNGRMNHRTKVLELTDDEATSYAILAHRWTGQEVSYKEIIDLANMEKDEQNEVRQRLGYRKILASCEQAKKDEFEWLWADTCCIDKRSSAELSEATTNALYRWYSNSGVCYVYLQDVHSSFPRCASKGMYVSQFQGLAGVVLAWMDATGDDSTARCPIVVAHHWSSAAYLGGWTFSFQPSQCCSDNIGGRQSDDD